MPKMTKKGARSVTAMLDRMATLFQTEWKVLGIPQHIAADMAYRSDLLSDTIEKAAGLSRKALSEFDPVKESGFDPETVGEEQSGAIETVEAAEPFMAGEFTQQENRELRERVESGDLGPDRTVDEPQAPQAGKQAFEKMGRQMVAKTIGTSLTAVQGAVVSAPRLAAQLRKLAHALMDVQTGVLAGSVSADQADRAVKAVNLVLPHLANAKGNETKVAKMLEMASKVAGELPPWLKKEDDKEEEAPKEEEPKKEEPKKDEKKEEGTKESGKKASHGFNLFA